MARAPKNLLLASAVDPSGGAGLLLDLSVARALGVRSCGVTTAATAQSAAALRATYPIPAPFVRSQLVSLEEDLGKFAAAKVGALGSAATARVLARWARENPRTKIVLDPVALPSRGKARLFVGDAATYRRALLALIEESTLLTPNIPEALWLLGRKSAAWKEPPSEDAQLDLAFECLALGAKAILLKGGHLSTMRGRQITDVLVTRKGEAHEFLHPRRPGAYHGTGCFLSSAIAAHLAKGLPLEEATAKSIAFLEKAMARARPAGRARVKTLVP